MHLRRSGIVLAVFVGLGVGALPAGAAAGTQGASKVGLHNDFTFVGFCRGAVATPANTAGFAVINATKDTVSATVSLKDGLPDQTYLLHLVQIPSFNGCFVGQEQETLTTNEDGNGTAHVRVPRIAGTTAAWVYLERAGFFEYITEEVPIT